MTRAGSQVSQADNNGGHVVGSHCPYTDDDTQRCIRAANPIAVDNNDGGEGMGPPAPSTDSDCGGPLV